MNRLIISEKSNRLLIASLIITFLLPYSNVSYGIMVALMLVYCIVLRPRVTVPGFIGILFFVISLFINTLTQTYQGQFIDYVNALTFVLFFCTVNTRAAIGFKSPRLIVTMLVIVFATQVIMILHINPFDSFLQTWYTNEALNFSGQLSNIVNAEFRSGGFLGNPNQCMKFCNTLFACYLCIRLYRNCKGSTPMLIMYVLIMAFAGSRTGMICTVTLLFIFLMLKYRNNRRMLIPWAIIAVVTLIVLNSWQGFETMRMFQASAGMDNSFKAKIDVLTLYVDKISINGDLIRLLFGNFFESQSSIFLIRNRGVIDQFDSDLGLLTYSYGIIGILIMIWLVIYKFKEEHYPIFFAVIFLWMFSASVFHHVKFFVFFNMIMMLNARHMTGTSAKSSR